MAATILREEEDLSKSSISNMDGKPKQRQPPQLLYKVKTTKIGQQLSLLRRMTSQNRSKHPTQDAKVGQIRSLKQLRLPVDQMRLFLTDNFSVQLIYKMHIAILGLLLRTVYLPKFSGYSITSLRSFAILR